MNELSGELKKSEEKDVVYVSTMLKSIHVLVVEDNPMNQKMIKRVLDRWKCTYHIAENGLEAVAMSKQQTYDIVLMDIHMPELDGVGATIQIRGDENNINNKTPIVALTGTVLLDEKNKALEVGMNDFLSKPFLPIQLENVVLEWINKEMNASRKEMDIPVSQSKNEEEVLKIDLSYLEKLSRKDTTFIKDMINIFLQEIPKATREMLGSYKEKNYDVIVDTAHRIKSNYMMLGMKGQQEAASDIEQMIKTKMINDEICITHFLYCNYFPIFLCYSFWTIQ